MWRIIRFVVVVEPPKVVGVFPFFSRAQKGVASLVFLREVKHKKSRQNSSQLSSREFTTTTTT